MNHSLLQKYSFFTTAEQGRHGMGKQNKNVYIGNLLLLNTDESQFTTETKLFFTKAERTFRDDGRLL